MNRKLNIAIFTKTNWNEPPRIRHQFARLMKENGHNVFFFEKSSFRQLKIKERNVENIFLIKHFELIHHQLRSFQFLIGLNNIFNKIIIKKSLSNKQIDLIVNFNYDYIFLKELFPNIPIITVINDDFPALAKPWMKESIKRQLKKTCQISDIVFAVSYPLVEQVKKYNKNAYLFLPWAQRKYERPLNGHRNVVLYWGYINNRLDWNTIEYLLNKGIKLRFVGAVLPNVSQKIEKYSKYKNFEYFLPCKLDELKLDDVCCSILPYDCNRSEMEVVTANNRVFQILSYGIPLVYAALPNLIKSPKSVIYKCKEPEEYLEAIRYFTNNFDAIQNDIQGFLKEHYAKQRYEYFCNTLNEVIFKKDRCV